MKRLSKHFNLNNRLRWGTRFFAIALLFYIFISKKSLFENKDFLDLFNVNYSQRFLDEFAISFKLLITLPEVFSLFVVINVLLIVRYLSFILHFIFLKTRVVYVKKDNSRYNYDKVFTSLSQPIYKLKSSFLC